MATSNAGRNESTSSRLTKFAYGLFGFAILGGILALIVWAVWSLIRPHNLGSTWPWLAAAGVIFAAYRRHRSAREARADRLQIAETKGDQVAAWATRRIRNPDKSEAVASAVRSFQTRTGRSLPLESVYVDGLTANSFIRGLALLDPLLGRDERIEQVMSSNISLPDGLGKPDVNSLMVITDQRLVHMPANNAAIATGLSRCIDWGDLVGAVRASWLGNPDRKLTFVTTEGKVLSASPLGGDDVDWPPRVHQLPRLVESKEGLRRGCPTCAEPVLVDARLCPHCRSHLGGSPS